MPSAAAGGPRTRAAARARAGRGRRAKVQTQVATPNPEARTDGEAADPNQPRANPERPKALPRFEDVSAAAFHIRDGIRKTRARRSDALSEITGCLSLHR